MKLRNQLLTLSLATLLVPWAGWMLVQELDVRSEFDRICWVSVGQEPDMTALQQTLHYQLAATVHCPTASLAASLVTSHYADSLIIASIK